MATIITRNNRLFLVFYDKLKKASRQKALALINTKENMKIAKSIAKEFQNEINDTYNRFNSAGVKVITLEVAYDHFKKLNSDKHPKTKSEYDRFYNLFTTQYSKDLPCMNINKLETEQWLMKVKLLDKKQNTKRNYYKVLKKFLGFLFEYNYCLPFKLNKEVTIPAEIRPIEIFRDEDVKIIFKHLHTRSRNFQTLVWMLFYTGLRPSDIINISIEDIDLKNQILRYYSIKTDEHFILPIHNQLLQFLKDRINELKSGHLLDYSNSTNMSKAFRRYLLDIKIPAKKYTLRTFRKSFISSAYKSGIDLAMVSKLVGHKQITTTSRYYNKIEISQQHLALNKLNLNITDDKNPETEN